MLDIGKSNLKLLVASDDGWPIETISAPNTATTSDRYLAYDLGPKNIRVNAISAGPINTLAARGISGFTDILKVAREKSPLRRNTEPEEVGDTALFLFSPLSRGITGEVLFVDCGYNILGF